MKKFIDKVIFMYYIFMTRMFVKKKEKNGETITNSVSVINKDRLRVLVSIDPKTNVIAMTVHRLGEFNGTHWWFWNRYEIHMDNFEYSELTSGKYPASFRKK